MAQLEYAMVLQAVSNIGDITARKLIHYCDSPDKVFKVSKRRFYTKSGIGSVTVKNLQSSKAMALAEKELTFNQKHNINAFYFEETATLLDLNTALMAPLFCFRLGL